MCTTADIWTTHHRSFTGIACHWIKAKTLDRKSAALTGQNIRSCHTSDVIDAKLDRFMHSSRSKEKSVPQSLTMGAISLRHSMNVEGVKWMMR